MKQKKSARDKRARKPVDPKEGHRIADRSAKRGVPEVRAEVALPKRAKLTGGDIDADWQRADDIGEEAVGGSVPTPDQDRVDDLGRALGVPRAPDEEVRTSAEILEARDRNRWERE